MSSPSIIKTYHQTTYPAISPTRDELSCKGKTVIITGAGQGVGAATALSYAKAGATKIALLGRTESKLQETKSKIESVYPEVHVYIAVADVSNAESIGLASHNIRVTLGAWDIFVHSAASLGELVPLTGSDIDEWWSVFEVNTKSIVIFAKHFLTKCRLPGATFICVSSAVVHIPVEQMIPSSAYTASKIATVKLCEWLAKENKGLRVFQVHPGTIRTPMSDRYRAASNVTDIYYVDVELAADFFVWCASAEAEFLRDRYLWATWDVEELIRNKDVLEKNPRLLRLQLEGWP